MMYTPGGAMPVPPNTAWRAFAVNMTNLPQYDMSPASALVSLGGEKGTLGMGVGGMSLQDAGADGQHWGPLVHGFGGPATGEQ